MVPSSRGRYRRVLLAPPKRPGRMHLVCYLREGDQVFETYWTTIRGVEAVDNSYALMDLTLYGRQEPWEDSPPGWPQQWHVDPSNFLEVHTLRTNGRPIAQWSRLEAGHSDDLTVGPRSSVETQARRERVAAWSWVPDAAHPEAGPASPRSVDKLFALSIGKNISG